MPQSDPQPPIRGRLADYQPLCLLLIEDLAGRRLFQQYTQRYHPLGAIGFPTAHNCGGLMV
jgi:hypothetical protein